MERGYLGYSEVIQDTVRSSGYSEAIRGRRGYPGRSEFTSDVVRRSHSNFSASRTSAYFLEHRIADKRDRPASNQEVLAKARRSLGQPTASFKGLRR